MNFINIIFIKDCIFYFIINNISLKFLEYTLCTINYKECTLNVIYCNILHNIFLIIYSNFL